MEKEGEKETIKMREAHWNMGFLSPSQNLDLICALAGWVVE